MKLKHYLRGLGLGIVVSTLIVSAGNSGKAAPLTDEEIKARAEQLGMVDENEMLLSQAGELAEEAAKDDDREEEINENAMEPVSENDSKSEKVSDNDAAVSKNDVISSDTADSGEVIGEGSLAGSFLGAGAGSARKNKDSSKKPEKIVTVAEIESRNSDAGKAGEGASERMQDILPKEEEESTDASVTAKEQTKAKEEAQTQEDEDTQELTKAQEQTQTIAASGPVSITIVKGESSTAVAKKLQMAGVIPDAMQFDSYLCLNGYDRKLVTGAHNIPAGASARDVAEIITGK